MTTLLTTENSPKRRDKIVIMAEILSIARMGALKTQIMYRANLSFEQLSEYLGLLTRKNLLEKTERDGKELYKATEKGLTFTERHNALSELLK